MKTPTNQPTNQLINKTIQVVVLIMFLFNINSSLMIAQDSTGINNPNLINTLDPGLYKIDKVFEDGAVQENVIYKDNNE